MSQLFFAPGYIRLLYRFLQLEPAQEAALFEASGASAEDVLAATPDLSFAQQMVLCRNALALSEPGLGLRIGGQLQLAAHGVLGTAMQNARHLAEALDTFAELGAARASFFRLDCAVAEQTATLTLVLEGLDEDLVPFFTESILSTLSHCIAFYAGGAGGITGLQLAYADPGYGTQYEQAFAAPVHFGLGSNLLTLPAAHLQLTPLDPDPQVFAESVARCRQEIESHAEGVVPAIEQFLWSNPGKLWRVDELAEVLHTSTRTLLRRLKAADTSYQAVRDKVLQQQAELYLGSMSVADVAAALGFADESSFRRSFRRWTGVAPRQASPMENRPVR